MTKNIARLQTFKVSNCKTAVCFYNKHRTLLSIGVGANIVIVLGVNGPFISCFVHTDIQMHIWELFNGTKCHENNFSKLFRLLWIRFINLLNLLYLMCKLHPVKVHLWQQFLKLPCCVGYFWVYEVNSGERQCADSCHLIVNYWDVVNVALYAVSFVQSCGYKILLLAKVTA